VLLDVLSLLGDDFHDEVSHAAHGEFQVLVVLVLHLVSVSGDLPLHVVLIATIVEVEVPGSVDHILQLESVGCMQVHLLLEFKGVTLDGLLLYLLALNLVHFRKLWQDDEANGEGRQQ